jgi:hypothetical protein
MGMAGIRTQVHLTQKQRQALETRRKREGKTLAAVVRDAVDAYVAADVSSDRQTILDRTFGSIPDLEVPSRDEWEERAKRLGY